MSPRKRADSLTQLVVDADGEKPRQAGLVFVEDAHRRVAGAGQLPRLVEHADQDRVRVALGNEGSADLKQSAELAWVQIAGFHPGSVRRRCEPNGRTQ